MARPIEYNKEAVLNSAMKLFWEKGYEATSMKELVQATGLSTRSMYNVFGSKNGLFQACLNWYYDTGIQKRYEELIRENGLIAIRHFLESLAKRETKDGCMYVNTASNRPTIDHKSIMVVDDFFDDLEAIFKSKLSYAIEHEGYVCEPDLRAKQLIIIVQGLSVYSKGDNKVEDTIKVINDLLKSMNI